MQSVVEAICKFIKVIMRCLKHLFGPFVEPYFNIMIKNYSVSSVNSEQTSFNLLVLSGMCLDDFL